MIHWRSWGYYIFLYLVILSFIISTSIHMGRTSEYDLPTIIELLFLSRSSLKARITENLTTTQKAQTTKKFQRSDISHPSFYDDFKLNESLNSQKIESLTEAESITVVNLIENIAISPEEKVALYTEPSTLSASLCDNENDKGASTRKEISREKFNTDASSTQVTQSVDVSSTIIYTV